jgi:hypothetical protein
MQKGNKWSLFLTQLKRSFPNNRKKILLFTSILLPLFCTAQQNDSLKFTRVSGRVTSAVTGQPLPYINVKFTGSSIGISTDNEGKFNLGASGAFTHVTFSSQGYQQVIKAINNGQDNIINVKLKPSQTQLKEVVINSGKNKRYRNKGNPAVELIQQVIDHKSQNRMESTDYLQYDRYERIGLSLFNVSPKLVNSRIFGKYKFLLDSTTIINGRMQTSLPVYFNEKLYQNFYRKTPEKSIQVLTAEKGINIIKFVDTVGLDIYLNRLYGNNIDIYENNIFIIVNQFLSPIADHSPDFYKFFITDTIQNGKEKLVELSFTPRNKGDLLFEGKLRVTLDGRYAVESCELNVNKQININFMRSLKINLDFKQYPNGRFYLTKSNVAADFGALKNRGMGVFGERTVVYSNYKLNSPLPDQFYEGKSLQKSLNSSQADTGYLAHHGADSSTNPQDHIYARLNKLQNMQSFKTVTWIASTFTGGYADVGKVLIGPIGSFFSFNKQEGRRFQLSGRTTPLLNQSIYLDGYAGYGTTDKQFKYDFNTYFSLNKKAPYRFPNDYFKIGYLYDVELPGHNFAVTNEQGALTSFSTGKNDYWQYSRIFSVAYVKDFENHFSYNIAFRNWNQQAAGTLVYELNDADNTIVHNLTTTELDIGLRYAPHEQIIEGTQQRHSIHSKYPIFNLQINHGFKGLLNGSYTYNNIYANIYKRFYFSQLGYSDVTVLGSMITGKVPFPLLSILPANQSIAYDPNAYNQMDYLEFVSDHYVGLNFTQSFNGFFLNKIPLIKHLKWREYLTFKVLYGGLRNENNPMYSKDLYQFPVASNEANGTFALGNVPYLEAGAGIGNIFKFVRIDGIRRFNYLDHPGVSQYGVKVSFDFDF